ncbi:MAG: aspartate carbamoyltransferase catalytic subunit [Candidatus Firestonebacteria bacterium]|nr:aspartate carbamoyltransferase catalytic subunit [Candidatus Firestonebacteria bacterium]
MSFKRKDLLGLEELTSQEIKYILQLSESFKEILSRPIKKVPTLRGKTLINLFFEPSTRTRTSFELAGKRLSADVVNISSTTSSVVKGETLKDTGKTIEAMNADIIVIRHSLSGAPYRLAQTINASVINAGDGAHEHPTQGLLDLFTIKEKKKKIEGLHVCIVGDIRHSRVARSNIWGLTKLGARVTLAAPPTLLPPGIEKLGENIRTVYNLSDCIKDIDVLYILRIQLERQKGFFFPSIREYSKIFGIDENKLKKAKDDLMIMHPGPINREVEISSRVADSKSSHILDQVSNGIAVRMAVLYLLAGGNGDADFN